MKSYTRDQGSPETAVHTNAEEIKEEEKFDQPASLAPLQQPAANAPPPLAPQPRAQGNRQRRRPGRPVRYHLPFDQREYLKPVHGRALFRKLVLVFKNDSSVAWSKLARVLS